MNKLEQSAWLALDVLENERCHVSANWDNVVKAITALREALANTRSSIRSTSEYSEQAEQSQLADATLEPVHIENIYKRGDKYFAWIGDDYVQIYTAPVQQAEQEPVGYVQYFGNKLCFRESAKNGWHPVFLNAAPVSIEAAVLAEREACAKVCEDMIDTEEEWDSCYWNQGVERCAAAIRQRAMDLLTQHSQAIGEYDDPII